MLIRIVRMTFQEDRTADFLSIFERSKQQIRSFEGCQHLELLQDIDQRNVYMTYSYWESQAALDQYRASALFRSTWAATKVLFADKPSAYSVERLQLVSVDR